VQLLKTMRDTDRSGEPHLFPGRINDKGQIDIRRPWEQVCFAAGLATKGKDGRINPTVRFHDLRHSYASLLVSSGLSLPIIGRLLGHTQAQTTQRYAHLFDDPLREATERVGRLVSGGQ
jgi:integrase